MMSAPVYEINLANVSHETIDGEVIIIHFETGNYFCLRESAVDLWELLLKPGSLEQIAARMNLTEQQRDQVGDFLGQLEEEGLILVHSNEVSEEESVASTRILSPSKGPLDLVMEKFEDMQKMLLADPIHEVDQAGWPHLPEK